MTTILGKVRGLLCMNCNTALGGFKENIDILQKAIEYLEKTINGK
jgi:predicted transcriptional regulator YheO